MKRLKWLLLAVAAGLGAWFIVRSGKPVPEVRFVKPAHETLVSNLPTNGKVEPFEWTAVHADAAGLVERLPVRQGQAIAKDALIAQLGAPGAADQIQASQARVEQAQAELDTLNKGGTASELTDIANQLSRATLDRAEANKEYGSLRRLNEKQAATAVEVEAVHARVQQLDLQIESLERQKAALVTKSDVSASQARLHEAESTVRGTQARLGKAVIRSPLSGVVYDLPARLGAYLNAGDLVAAIGKLDRLRVRVYVDEPELGRVAVGQPVKITWDALPSRSWQGTVERLPTQITGLGTRQVGEVLCTIDNPDRVLMPGTNINAFIQTSVVPNALTVPKETIQRHSGVTDVYVLENGSLIRRRRVEVGTFNVIHTQITSGLRDDEMVALPSDHVLKDGEHVKPILP
ncbi:MAG: efflux transporter periplasmic adaptor subunit [Bryobacterales bacterium]|nr:efflux transporter periplasmic adaptor subunit [Bryobacterales bacterium]